MDLTGVSLDALKDELEKRGYVLIREKSYKAAQRRQGIAASQRDWAEREKESAERWAHNCLKEERRLRERLNEIIHLATLHGMTTDDLIAFNEKLGKPTKPEPPRLALVTDDEQ
jgi:hypothetical protein